MITFLPDPIELQLDTEFHAMTSISWLDDLYTDTRDESREYWNR